MVVTERRKPFSKIVLAVAIEFEVAQCIVLEIAAARLVALVAAMTKLRTRPDRLNVAEALIGHECGRTRIARDCIKMGRRSREPALAVGDRQLTGEQQTQARTADDYNTRKRSRTAWLLVRVLPPEPI